MPDLRPPKTRLRVACFGAGWVTENRHVPAMRTHGGFDVVAVVDRSPERARVLAERLGVRHHAAVLVAGELPFRDEIDAVSCGTAPFAHYEVVRGALEAGKHVITEKPFAMSVGEGEELVALASQSGRVLAVVHNFQFARAARKLERWVARGRTGELKAIWAFQLSNPRRRLPDWLNELPLGLFYDESPHLLYLARAVAGAELDPLSALAHASRSGSTPSQIDVSMRSGGVPLTFEMNFEAPVSEWHLIALYERGLVALDLFRDIASYVPNDGRHVARTVLQTSVRTTWDHWRGYLPSGGRHLRGKLSYGNEEVFRRFHDAVVSGARPAGIDAADALAVLRLQHWIVDEARAPAPRSA